MSPILGILASQISGHLWSPTGAYDALASVTVGSGGASSINFAGIPTGYKHLQVRWTALTSASYSDLAFRFNSDSGNNYTFHGIEGNGASVSGSNYGTSLNNTPIGIGGASSSIPAVGVMDLLDYANTNKYKTARSLFGTDSNGAGYIIMRSGLWLNTSSVSTITISVPSGTINQYSSFALYGVK